MGHIRYSHCFIHAPVIEPITTDTYRVCFECGHVYETEKDLEAVEQEKWGRLTLAERIMACPLCVHDW